MKRKRQLYYCYWVLLCLGKGFFFRLIVLIFPWGQKLNLRPIYTARNFRHGSDRNGTGTKKCSTARVKFCDVNDFAGPKFHPCLGPSEKVVRVRVKLVRMPEILARLG